MPFTLLLLAFFIPSIALSRLGSARKRSLVDVGKSGPRDAMQVFANGGVATLCAIAFAFSHDARWGWGFAGAYAAATADTWGTEIGTLVRQQPRSILTLRPIPTGLSGGVTLAGTLAEIAGALWLGAIAFILLPPRDPRAFVAIAFGGIAGATFDSVLGATAQELRRCDACGRMCETNPHACGNPTRLVRGLPAVSNDLVNLLATAAGSFLAYALI